MATVYLLLVLACLVLIPFVWYFTRPPSTEKSPASELKEPIRKPASGVTRTQRDDLPPIDYPEPMAPVAEPRR